MKFLIPIFTCFIFLTQQVAADTSKNTGKKQENPKKKQTIC